MMLAPFPAIYARARCFDIIPAQREWNLLAFGLARTEMGRDKHGCIQEAGQQ
jgi:hypothetical protein